MNERRDSIRILSLASFAAVAMVAVACGRTPEREPTEKSVSLTSARIETGTRHGESPEDPADGRLVCAGMPVVAVTATDAVAGERPARFNGPPRNARLDEAIRHEVESEPAASVDRATTTASATISQAEPARPSTPSHLSFASQLPPDYRLERVRLLVDGAVAYDGADPASIALSPGDHLVEVFADYRVAAPLSGVEGDSRFQVHSMHNVPAEGMPTDFEATALPRGGVRLPVDERVSLGWQSVSLH